MEQLRKIWAKVVSPSYLAIVYPCLLILPNIFLSFTESWSILAKITCIVLPLGIYYILMGLSDKTARTVLYLFLLSQFCSVQLVLLYVFGEGIIGIDMYVNAVTSNPGEASELLGNLAPALLVVIFIYIPPFALAIYQAAKHLRSPQDVVLKLRKSGIYVTSIGLILLLLSYICVPGYNVMRQLFPVNVVSNFVSAISRVKQTREYRSRSLQFTYDVTPTRDKNEKEVYVLVIGETSRPLNWEIFGYNRETNPMLKQHNDLLCFNKVLTEANTTMKSVPLMLSYLDATNYGDSIYTTKSIFSAFNEAGYRTAFLSNQRRNHSFIDFFGEQAQIFRFITDGDNPQLDMQLEEPLFEIIDQSPSSKIFVVLHCYGSHFNYRERYPEAFAHYTPDKASGARYENVKELRNAYDNSIRYTDAFLNNIINGLDSLDCLSAMVYVSDHGEDLFDDDRHRILHSSPNPTYYQLHVPFIMWFSDEYCRRYPQQYAVAKSLENADISSSLSLFHTLLDLAGLKSPYLQSNHSLISRNYTTPKRYFLNDYNEAAPLTDCGLKSLDIEQFKRRRISLD